MGFSEEVAMNNKKHWIKLAASGLLSPSTWGLSAPQGSALPIYQGAGSANVSGLREGANSSIRVTGNRGAVKWESFSVNKGEIFRIEGNSHQTILNRVVGGDQSFIGGTVQSGPKFTLSNPNGITVLGTGRTVAPSTVLTTGEINIDAWLNRSGEYQNQPEEFLNITLDSNSAINLDGTILARDSDRGGFAGLFAESIQLGNSALIDASGSLGGGTILVGGSWQNSQPWLSQATLVNIQQGAVLNASATKSGDGGTIVAWSDIKNPASKTFANGQFLATGGPEAGDGGQIETSSYWLDVSGIQVDATSKTGLTGTWLLDPESIQIVGSSATTSVGAGGATVNAAAGNTSILATDLNTQLTSANITLNANTDINFTRNFTYTGSADRNLVLDAETVALGADIATSGTGKLNLTIGTTKSGNLYTTGSTTRSIATNNGAIAIKGNIGGSAGLALNSGSGTSSLNSGASGGFAATATTISTGSINFTYSGTNGASIGINFKDGSLSGGTLAAGSSVPKGYVEFKNGQVVELNATIARVF